MREGSVRESFQESKGLRAKDANCIGGKRIDKVERLALNDYFMEIAHLVAKRSTCLQKHVGFVIVKDKRILAMSYNDCLSVLRRVDSGRRLAYPRTNSRN